MLNKNIIRNFYKTYCMYCIQEFLLSLRPLTFTKKYVLHYYSEIPFIIESAI